MKTNEKHACSFEECMRIFKGMWLFCERLNASSMSQQTIDVCFTKSIIRWNNWEERMKTTDKHMAWESILGYSRTCDYDTRDWI